MSGESALGYPERRKTYWDSVLSLIGHLIGTGVIFISFLIITWVIEVVLRFLNCIHSLPSEILSFVTSLELGFVYADAILCAVVLFAGLLRFCIDIIGARR